MGDSTVIAGVNSFVYNSLGAGFSGVYRIDKADDPARVVFGLRRTRESQEERGEKHQSASSSHREAPGFE